MIQGHGKTSPLLSMQPVTSTALLAYLCCRFWTVFTGLSTAVCVVTLYNLQFSHDSEAYNLVITTIIYSTSFLKRHYTVLLQFKNWYKIKLIILKFHLLTPSLTYTQNNIIYNCLIIQLSYNVIGQQIAGPGKYFNCHKH